MADKNASQTSSDTQFCDVLVVGGGPGGNAEYIKSRGKDETQFYRDTIAMCPEVANRLTEATLTGPPTATGNFSYRADRMAGKDYIMLGDAFAFIDPMFSTGVYLAMNSAFRGAEAVRTCLHEPRHAARALKQFDKQVRSGIGSFSWFIYRVTRPSFRDLFTAPSNIFRIEEAILSLLSGDVFRRTPGRSRLLIFKFFYYLNMLFGFGRPPANREQKA